MPTDLDHEYYFENSKDAATKLIDILPIRLLEDHETVIIGVSESGVYYANEIANKINAQMDILLTEPIMAPNNSELAIAMVSETEEVVIHGALTDSFGINEDYIYGESQRKYGEEVLGYINRYRQGQEIVSVKGKYVVLVDECIETGLTMMVALKSMIEGGAKNIYIATPLLDRAVFENLLSVCDGVFCPYKIKDYISIEYYYRNYEILDFDDIIEILKKQKRKNRTSEISE